MSITEDDILASADNLAEAATTFSGHGYQMFLAAREAFIQLLHKFAQERAHPS